LNYTACAPGNQAVKLNEEAREFKWVTMDEALAMPINVPTLKLLRAVADQKLKHG